MKDLTKEAKYGMISIYEKTRLPFLKDSSDCESLNRRPSMVKECLCGSIREVRDTSYKRQSDARQLPELALLRS